MLAQLLKSRTADAHAHVESQLGLLDPKLTATRLGEVVGRLSGFWAGTELTINAWFITHPALSERLDWQRRRRADSFAADLATLPTDSRTASPFPVASPVFDVVAVAEVFGWLYVAEGSTLGGAVINRHLTTSMTPAVTALRSFTPYIEGPGPMWRSYQRALHEWADGDDHRNGQVISAALATFEDLQRWLEPLRQSDAA